MTHVVIWRDGSWKTMNLLDAESAANDPDWLVTIPAGMKPLHALKDRLAEFAHAQWAHWMKYLFSKCSMDGVLPFECIHRWHRQMETPYFRLPKDEQASGLRQADKMVDLLAPVFDAMIDRTWVEAFNIAINEVEQETSDPAEHCMCKNDIISRLKKMRDMAIDREVPPVVVKPVMKVNVAVADVEVPNRIVRFYATLTESDFESLREFGYLVKTGTPDAYSLTVDARFDFQEVVNYLKVFKEVKSQYGN